MKRKVPFNYRWGEPYDDNLVELVKTIKGIVDNNDDYRLLITGDTGTGKSHLGLWINDLYANEPDVGCIGFNEQSYAQSIKYAAEKRSHGDDRVIAMYDEANVYGVESMSEFNREIMKLMGEIRGLNIFHVWCMPNPGMLPSSLIDETFDGIIYIYTKTKDKPRLYAYFDTKSITKMRDKEGTKSRKAKISLAFLHTIKDKYAMFRGAFKEYNGLLRNAYEKKKEQKMKDRISTFFEKFGGDRVKVADVAREYNVSDSTMRRKVKKWIDDKTLTDKIDYVINGLGIPHLTALGKEKVGGLLNNDNKISVIPRENGVLTLLQERGLYNTRDSTNRVIEE